MPTHEEVFGTVEIARLLRVSPATVVNWIQADRIPAYRTPGGHRRVRRTDLVDFIRENGFPMPASLGQTALKILIVDDDPGVREVVTEAFLELGEVPSLELHAAADGTTGLIEVGRHRPDVLILDIFMPGMDGFEVCKRIREVEGISPLVLVISGNRSDWVRSKAIASGADAFFPKPLDLEELTRAALAGAELMW